MTITKPRLSREVIAMRVARDLRDGDYVNLGIGIPTLVSNFVPMDRTIIYQSQSGVLHCGPLVEDGHEDIDLINAGGQFLQLLPGMSFFHSTDAFNMIRGGHIDVTVLGALQVSEKGDLANWMMPGRGVGNIGGAMDLVTGVNRVVVAMEHTDRNGSPKVVKECTYLLTGKKCVDLIVTDLAVIDVVPNGLLLKEVAPGWSPEEVQQHTGAKLIVASDVCEITL